MYIPDGKTAALAALSQRTAFMRAQQCIGLDMNAVQSAQASALEVSFNSMDGLPPADASEIITAVNAGPWTTHEKQRLVLALSNAVSATGAGRVGQRAIQTCEYLQNYLLPMQLQLLQNPEVSRSSKIQTLSNWMWLLGMTCPGIPLLKRATALVMCADMNGSTAQFRVSPMTPVEQHDAAHKIQWHIKQRDARETHPH